MPNPPAEDISLYRRLRRRVRGLFLSRLGLMPQAFRDAARGSTGLSDFGHRDHAEGMQRLLTSLRGDARLTIVGRIMMQRAVLIALEQRLLLEDLRQREPGKLNAPILPPIIVTGLPRSGTTFLHRLLAVHPDMRAPVLSELVEPVRRRKEGRLADARLKFEMSLLRFLAPGLDAKHFTRLDEPEECIFATMMSFRGMVFWTFGPVYTYMNWYRDASRHQKYRDYHDILRLLQARDPARRLALKAPDHLGGMEELLRAVPEALVVVCHRDPVASLTSFNSLLQTLHVAISRMPDARRLGETNLAFFEAETRKYMRARGKRADRILEIGYDELIADPAGVARRIFARAGLAMTPEAEDALARHIAANPKDRYGRHDYDPADFGQTGARIAARLAHYTAADRG
ncbi:sulfotransferase [soil metagenome]